MDSNYCFVKQSEVRSVIVTRHSVTKEESGLIFKKTVMNEVKTSATKVLFNNGQIAKLEEHKFKNKELDRRKCETYKDGVLLESTEYDGVGHIITITKNRIENGNIVECIEYDDRDRIKGHHHYKYDEHGNRIETTYYWPSTSFYSSSSPSTYKYTWNYKNGLDGVRIETRKDCDDNSVTEYHYNKQNKLVKKIEYNPNGSIKHTAEYTYDSHGNSLTDTFDGKYVERRVLDDHGECIKFTWYPDREKGSNRTITSTYDLVYDSHGNWTQLRQYRDGGSLSSI